MSNSNKEQLIVLAPDSRSQQGTVYWKCQRLIEQYPNIWEYIRLQTNVQNKPVIFYYAVTKEDVFKCPDGLCPIQPEALSYLSAIAILFERQIIILIDSYYRDVIGCDSGDIIVIRRRKLL